MILITTIALLYLFSICNAAVKSINVMINGLPGPMALATAQSCINRGYSLIPLGFTGDKHHETDFTVEGSNRMQKVRLVKGPGLANNEAVKLLKELKAKYPDMVIVDYTHPSAILPNIKCYVECGCDFVMGTTGGDAKAIEQALKAKDPTASPITAVIAPNMAKQIVALQAGLLEMSKRFPGSFKGYKLEVVESHQSSKADTSGTAKAVVASLGTLNGDNFKIEAIRKLRDKDSQIAFGVPESALGGHAYHTYRFTSPDDTVVFEIKHNVVGRKVYAEGTADAVDFVNTVRKNPLKRKLYNMIDVLEFKS